VVLVLAFALAACGLNDASRLLEGPDADYGKSLFSALQARDLKTVRDRMDPFVLGTAAPSTFDQMAALFPPDAPQSVGVVGVNIKEFKESKDTTRRVSVTLQYEWENKWLLAVAMWRETPSGEKLTEGMNVRPLAKPLQETNGFELNGKGVANYVFLVLVIAFPLLCVTTLVICIRTPMLRERKILWCLGIVLGFCQFNLNWTTGAMSVTPLSVQLLAAAWARASPFAPHVFSISLPVFALFFLWRRHQGQFSLAKPAENVPLPATL